MTADMINHPPHYTSSPARCTCGRQIECIDVTRHMGFNLGNAVKYLWRADLKGAAMDDLRKAAWYISDEIAKREAANTLPDEGLTFAEHMARRDAERAEAEDKPNRAPWPFNVGDVFAFKDKQSVSGPFTVSGVGKHLVFAKSHHGGLCPFTAAYLAGPDICPAEAIGRPPEGQGASDLAALARRENGAYSAPDGGIDGE